MKNISEFIKESYDFERISSAEDLNNSNFINALADYFIQWQHGDSYMVVTPDNIKDKNSEFWTNKYLFNGLVKNEWFADSIDSDLSNYKMTKTLYNRLFNRLYNLCCKVAECVENSQGDHNKLKNLLSNI